MGIKHIIDNDLSNETPNDILIIDDNIGDAKLIGIYLEDSDLLQCTLTHCTTLKEGMRLIGNHQYAAILLDLTLPDSKGLEGIKKITQHHKVANIIVLTGMESRDI